VTGKVKIAQKGSNTYFTCYGKVLAVNGSVTKAYFTVVPSIQKELLERLKR
jgi:hypothetical protein